MAQPSRIEWTEYSWNPVTGCSPVSDGCQHCYARRMANRLQAMGAKAYRWGFKVTIHPDQVAVPLKWRASRFVFANSMSDMFHDEVPTTFIRQIFDIMNGCPQHTFQVLTKRSSRLLALSKELTWSHNIWMGVTVENEASLHRVADLQETGARVKFLSCEPLLQSIRHLPLKGIDWVIVGGESGPGARKMEREWATSIRDQCKSSGVPFFFKQWGGVFKKKNGRSLDGKIWSQRPRPISSITT